MNTLEQTHSECDSNLLNHLNGISTQATFACVRKLQGTFVACNSIRASRNLLSICFLDITRILCLGVLSSCVLYKLTQLQLHCSETQPAQLQRSNFTV
ncbi:uncharacterized protein LAJ45_07521 [Morchella importuna]|uniref:uncharacterized protein n=1 Tax=Morchella importuna TaxID=1174673 RepID=UPI001E8D225F|nr:uncharacterized protein LAJ45_07521 [Morchella importuna]KAH8148419.1 hypothetical protein LAJ45_07521 [Morchella importuna]